jgi:subtilisin family serine protease
MNPLQITRLIGHGSRPAQSFTQSPVTLGTAPGSTLKFDSAWDKGVIAKHAVIEHTAQGWVLRDLAATMLCDGARLREPLLLDGTVEFELCAGGPRLRVVAEAGAGVMAAAAPADQAVASPAAAPVAYYPAPPRAGGWNQQQHLVTATAALVILGLIIGGVVWMRRAPSGGNGTTPPVVGMPGRAPDSPPTPPPSDGDGPEDGAARRLIVKWKPGAGAEQIESLRSSFSARTFSTLKKVGNGRTEVLVIPAGRKAADVVRQLKQSGLVEFAEEDQIMHAYVHPNDPGYLRGQQWGLLNPGSNSPQMAATAEAPSARAWLLPKEKPVTVRLPRQAGTMAAATLNPESAGVDIHAADGWNVQTNARRVIVAVVDTGVRYTHEDLAANMWRNPGEIPGNGVDDDNNGVVDDVFGYNAVANSGDPMDDVGHGTHCAGIIGAVSNNDAGISGVAWNVQIMACKFLGTNGGSTSNALMCLDYAARMGAVIISNSWGSKGEPSEALKSTVQQLNDAGILFVVAAGNDGQDIDVHTYEPAGLDLPNVVTVGSIDADGRPSNFSNYGIDKVHLFAPGGKILSTFNQDDASYTRLSGTSMAAPFVTGALALLKTRSPFQDRPAALVQRLMNSLRPLPSLDGKCKTGGMLDLQALLESTAPGKTPGP